MQTFNNTFVLTLISAFLFITGAFAQSTADIDGAILTTAKINQNNNGVDLNFSLLSHDTHELFKIENNISQKVATINAGNQSTFSYRLSNMAKGEIHTYELKETLGNRFKYGTIFTGIEVPATHDKGIQVLLVDERIKSDLQKEIRTLTCDLESEGWEVALRYVNSNYTAIQVKSIIKSIYAQDPARTKSVFILGHVAVPYSGDHAEDGHSADQFNHRGAWPADGYYGDVDGVWTDYTVNSIGSFYPVNRNMPNDGKFDQTIFPSDIDLQVGRVDFYNLPAFTLAGESEFETEVRLLRSYLNRNHKYRTNDLAYIKKALVRDQLDFTYDIRYSSTTFKTATSVFGENSTDFIDYTYLQEKPYMLTHLSNYCQWTFDGCMHNVFSKDFAEFGYKGLFNFFLGSYIGDFNTENNVLRSSLASGNGLVAAWSGRPEWLTGSLAMGETFGEVALRTMNNKTIGKSYYKNHRSINLLGDPSLSLFPSKDIQATNLRAEKVDQGYRITWDANEETSGTYIYIKGANETKYTLVNPTRITAQEFVLDSQALNITYPLDVMVRNEKLEVTASGSFYRLSYGSRIKLEGANNNPPYATISTSDIIIGRQYTVSIEFSEAVKNFDPYTDLVFSNDDDIVSIAENHNMVTLTLESKSEVGSNTVTVIPGSFTDVEGKLNELEDTNGYYYNVTEGSLPTRINFNETQESFNGDDTGLALVQNEGWTLALQDNSWRTVSGEYTITANTMIELDFSSKVQGRLHGIAFANGQTVEWTNLLQVFGSRRFAENDYYNEYQVKEDWNRLVIPVGEFFQGDFTELVFISENILGQGVSNSKFRNFSIYENSVNILSETENQETVEILKFENAMLTPFDLGIDEGIGQVSLDKTTVLVAENACKAYPLSINVTESSVIEFDFLSSKEGKLHGIAFANEMTMTEVIKVTGTQNEGIELPKEYTIGQGWEKYTAQLNAYIDEGFYNKILFIMNDEEGNYGTAYFRNIKVYESDVIIVEEEEEQEEEDTCTILLEGFDDNISNWTSIFSDAQISIASDNNNHYLEVNSPLTNSDFIYLSYEPQADYNDWSTQASISFDFYNEVDNNILVYIVDANNQYFYSSQNLSELGWTTKEIAFDSFQSLSNTNETLATNEESLSEIKQILFVISNNPNQTVYQLDNLNTHCKVGDLDQSIENRNYSNIDPIEIIELMESQQVETSIVDIKAYPNPTTDYINISLDQNHIDNDVKIFVLDMKGQIVAETLFDNNNGVQTVDLQNFVDGMYTVQVSGKSFSSAQKIIVGQNF